MRAGCPRQEDLHLSHFCARPQTVSAVGQLGTCLPTAFLALVQPLVLMQCSDRYHLTQHSHQYLHTPSTHTSRLQRQRLHCKPFTVAGREVYWAIQQSFCVMPNWLPQLRIRVLKRCWSLTYTPYSMHSPAGSFPNLGSLQSPLSSREVMTQIEPTVGPLQLGSPPAGCMLAAFFGV